MKTISRLGLWLGLALTLLTGCSTDTDSHTSPLDPAGATGDMLVIIDPPPAAPFESPLANLHHQWMRANWRNIEQTVRQHPSTAATPFRLDDPDDWLVLSPSILALVQGMEQGRVPAGYDVALDAARQMRGWMAEGVDAAEMHRRLSAHPVARKWPQHYEILMSTWLVARENGQDLGGRLDEYGYLVDMVGVYIAGPAGGAAASGGYLIGRLIREYYW